MNAVAAAQVIGGDVHVLVAGHDAQAAADELARIDARGACGVIISSNIENTNLGELALGHRAVGFVLEAFDRAAVVVVADPALEAGVTAAAGIGELGTQRGGIDRRLTERETAHLSLRPPVE